MIGARFLGFDPGEANLFLFHSSCGKVWAVLGGLSRM
jgi:hypothetical protein